MAESSNTYNLGVKITPRTIEEEKASARAERDEFELFCEKHNCFLRGCIYGHELNDYCICCGTRRPISNLYGKSIMEGE
jgi:hypothetical protein